MRIATWNINSLRLRIRHVQTIINELKPDILCLQETKVANDLFPHEQVRKLGLPHVHFSGEKSYNGVAILSRYPLAKPRNEQFCNKNDCRHIAAELEDGTELHNFYVPAGGDIPDPKLNDKFAHKLDFVKEMREWALKQKNKKMILVGDLNIAPLPNDVWSHKQLQTVVSHTPVEVEGMEALRDTLGWVDGVRHFVPPEQKLYSWWSYRNRDWEKSNRGRRLDHIWVTPALKNHLKSAEIHRTARNWEQPSDHVPVLVEIA